MYGFLPVEAVTPERFHKRFNLNVLGLPVTIKATLPPFPKLGGSIIDIGSIVAKSPVAGASVYAATKAAQDSITISMSKELGGRGIRVNSIDPGMIETEGSAPFLGGEFHKGVMQAPPLGSIGTPEDIATIARFLASKDAKWVSGEAIPVAGGHCG